MGVTSHVKNLHHIYFQRILHVQLRVTCRKRHFPATHSFRYMATIDITEVRFSATGVGPRCHGSTLLLRHFSAIMWLMSCHVTFLSLSVRTVTPWPWTSTYNITISRAINCRVTFIWLCKFLHEHFWIPLHNEQEPFSLKYFWRYACPPGKYPLICRHSRCICKRNLSLAVTFLPRGHKQCQGHTV